MVWDSKNFAKPSAFAKNAAKVTLLCQIGNAEMPGIWLANFRSFGSGCPTFNYYFLSLCPQSLIIKIETVNIER